MRGALIGGRFLLERPAASGGSGTVWRAREIHTGVLVAIKLIVAPGASSIERFAHEARVVASLDHAGLARYITHGATPDGTLYLATKWVTGCTLADQLAGSPISVAEAIALGQAAGGALGAIHARGIVHCDIKPSNLVLESGKLENIRIIDFGIACTRSAGSITMTGMAMGTPGYMAPEQARGEPVDSRADVFSLGCVLFKALTGVSPFAGEDAIAVLLRTALDEPCPLNELRPDVPAWLSALVARMLSKERHLRPADGAEVARLLRAAAPDISPSPVAAPAPSLTADEQRFASIVAAALSEVTMISSRDATPPTVPSTDLSSLLSAARAAVEPFRARVEQLGAGALVVLPPEMATATDEAVIAARCALALRSVLPPRARIALATGPGAVRGLPWGAVVDRAAEAVRSASVHVAIDAVSAALLRDRFHVLGEDGRLVLLGETTAPAITPPASLPPGSSPFVGRERDLRALLLLANGAFIASEASAAVVLAPAGIGKTRLAAEVVATLSLQPALTVWQAGGDPILTGVPFGALAGLLRRAAGILDTEEGPDVLGKLAALVSRFAPEALSDSISAQLGRVLEASPARGAADGSLYGDSIAAGDRIRHAWTSLLSTACAAGPVLLVLDDAHHADRTTIDYIGHTLHLLSHMPLFVLVLARPELKEAHPDLWRHAPVTWTSLRPLSPSYSAKLGRFFLGPQATSDLVSAVVAKAAGNPFFLEELARHAREGDAGDAPESVIAVLLSRLRRLDPLERRVLRAASVLGERFPASGVAALTGLSHELARALLDRLTQRDLLVRRGASAFSSVFAFRHAMLREAASAMLTSTDRALGHRLAAEWLAQRQGAPPHVIAEHFERGGAPAAAVDWYVRAAAAALEGNDLAAVIALGEHAIVCGASAEVRASVRIQQAEAHGLRAENAGMESAAMEAISLLEPGCPGWCKAVMLSSTACGRLGHDELAVVLGRRMLDAAAAARLSLAWQRAAARVATNLSIAGAFEVVDALLARIPAPKDTGADPFVRGALDEARAERALKEGRPGRAVHFFERAARAYRDMDDTRLAARAAAAAGLGYRAAGAYEVAARWLFEACDLCSRLGHTPIRAAADHALAAVLAGLGRPAEARAAAERALAAYIAAGNRRMEQATRIYLALILADEDRWEEAAHEANAASQPLPGAPGLRAHALAVLARVELALGRVPDAQAHAAEAFSILSAKGHIEEGAALVYLAHAECLSAAGDVRAARETLFEAERHIRESAQSIDDPNLRDQFLRRIPGHAATLGLVEAIRGASDS